jgi:predicted esterase
VAVEFDDFDAAADGVLDAYGKGAYEECLQLALAARARFPGHRARTTYWIACLQSRTGAPERAVTELREGLDRGDWWSEEWLRTDPDLEAARRLPDFEEIARRSGVAFGEQPTTHRPPVVLHPDRAPTSILVALHGSAETAERTAPAWRSCVSAGCTLIVPESPYRAMPDDERGWSWPSIDASARVVADSARTAAPVAEDSLPRVIGGFSQGGRVAARLAIARSPWRWRGAILFGPAAVTARGIETLRSEERPRFWVFVGENDRACFDGARRFVSDLHATGADAVLETAPDVDHEYPPDIEERLTRALAFVLR